MFRAYDYKRFMSMQIQDILICEFFLSFWQFSNGFKHLPSPIQWAYDKAMTCIKYIVCTDNELVYAICMCDI